MSNICSVPEVEVIVMHDESWLKLKSNVLTSEMPLLKLNNREPSAVENILMIVPYFIINTLHEVVATIVP